MRRFHAHLACHFSPQSGYTVLHYAAEHGEVAVIDELVRRGANVNAIMNYKGKVKRMHMPLAREPNVKFDSQHTPSPYPPHDRAIYLRFIWR